MTPKYSVVASMFGGWAVREEGRNSAIKRFPLKRHAVALGRKLARDNFGILKIHATDGTVQHHHDFT